MIGAPGRELPKSPCEISVMLIGRIIADIVLQEDGAWRGGGVFAWPGSRGDTTREGSSFTVHCYLFLRAHSARHLWRDHAALGLLACVGFLCLAGCETDLGPCEIASVRTLAYDEVTGLPAYRAQAVMHASCGSGAFCHSQNARGSDRFGAPSGMDFDLLTVTSCTADTDECRADRDTKRLKDGLFETFERRFDIWRTIQNGTMPPGHAGKSLLKAGSGYRDGNGNELGSIATKEGKEHVRNWLACSPPLLIVERTYPHPNGALHESIGAVVPPLAVDPPDVTWSSIYTKAFAPRCATAQCHDSASHAAALDMSSADIAYAALVGIAAAQSEGGTCGASGLQRVKAGDPDNSLLMQKLDQTQTCGSQMPLGSAAFTAPFLDPIRAWVNAGALDN